MPRRERPRREPIVDVRQLPEGNRAVTCMIAGMAFQCGAQILGAFNGGYKGEADERIGRHSIEEFVREGFPGILLATTIPAQEEAVEELKRQGFVPIARYWNAVHAGQRGVMDAEKGNQVTLWIRGRDDGNLEIVPPPEARG